MPPEPLTADDVLSRYRGLDGEAWPDDADLGSHSDSGLIPIGTFSRVNAYFQRVRRKYRADLVVLGSPPAGRSVRGLEECHFRGYDYGYYEGAYSSLSVLVHEVMSGQYDNNTNHHKAPERISLAARFRGRVSSTWDQEPVARRRGGFGG